MVTTAAVISALLKILREAGFTNLTLGEAPLSGLGFSGREIFRAMGLDVLARHFGVQLVDFNEEKFERVDYGDFELSVAKRVLETDKIINVAVLKTHNQSKVSLGLKNLKGCLSRGSKMFCHGAERDLNKVFPRISEKLPVELTIIDGIFALEKGPGISGKAYRTDLLVASRDIFACDVVGARLLGYEASEVPHLDYYARRHGRESSLAGIEVRGEDVASLSRRIEYDWEWTSDDTGPKAFSSRGISGLAVRKYDHTLCTGCATLYNPMLLLLMSAFEGHPWVSHGLGRI